MFADGAVNGELHGVKLLHIVFALKFPNSSVLMFLPLYVVCDQGDFGSLFVLTVFTLSKPIIFDLLISKVELSLAAS